MANLKNLEMAQAVSSHPHINITAGFLGLSQRITYTPTGSKVRVVIKDYAPEQGSKLEKALRAGNVTAAIAQVGEVQSGTIGNTRLEACVAADGSFVAVQLLRFALLRYEPLMDVRFFEGDEAQTVAAFIAK